MKIAMLLSLSQFEDFYQKVFNLDREAYIKAYRNDFSWEYAAGFSALNVDTVIYIPSNQTRTISVIDERTSVRFLELQKWWYVWERFSWLSRTPLGRYISEIFNAIAFLSDLQQALAEDEITHLYIQEYWTGRFDYLVRKCKIPVIGSDHGGKRYRQICLFKEKSFKKAAALTCQSLLEAQEVKKFSCQPVVLPNGVDTDFFVPSKGVIVEKIVFTVARLTDDQKRISDLIKSFQFLPAPWQLVIAGSGPDEQKLRKLTLEINLESRVTFLGFVRDRDILRQYYQSCRVFALVSAHEGLPLAVLEAMSCGCPVVVSDIPAFYGLVENKIDGIKVRVGDIRGIAKGITLADELRDKLSIASRAKVEREFSRTEMSKKLVRLLETVRP